MLLFIFLSIGELYTLYAVVAHIRYVNSSMSRSRSSILYRSVVGNGTAQLLREEHFVLFIVSQQIVRGLEEIIGLSEMPF